MRGSRVCSVEKWAGANVEHGKTVAHFVRAATSLLEFAPVTYAPLTSLFAAQKWAGANSNRGYGHPKAEGYQATPPARAVAIRRWHAPVLTVAKVVTARPSRVCAAEIGG